MKKQRRTKSYDELTFADNYLFCRILETYPDLCRQIIELLLHIKVESLKLVVSERTMQESIDAKGVRFDVYAEDSNGKRIFDLEMQTAKKKNLPKRARYYQSVIDMDKLAKGRNYTKLKDTYVIFLCLQDIFDKGLPVYFFENVCLADKNIRLKDGAYKVFFNAEKYDKLGSEEEKAFFKFLQGAKAESQLTKVLEAKVKFAKMNQKWRNDYMTWQQTIDEEKEIAYDEGKEDGIEEGREEGIEIGIVKGAEQKAIENAKSFYENGVSIEIIAKSLKMTTEQVKEITNASMA